MTTTARHDLDAAELHLLNARLLMQRRTLAGEFTRAEASGLAAAFAVALGAVAALRLALPDPARAKQGAAR